MHIIVFSWTAPALLAGRKTVTRRAWKESHARRFKRGQMVQAYDRSPQWGGQPIALLRLTQAPYLDSTADMPDADYEAEGFAYLDEHPSLRPTTGLLKPGQPLRVFFEQWRAIGDMMWVVRFTVERVLHTAGLR
jgi:hypothetical protein